MLNNNFLLKAIKNNSFGMFCCGINSNSQLGLGYGLGAKVKVLTSNGTDKWISIAAGLTHALGIKENGDMYGWGNNYYGKIGQSNTNLEYNAKTKIGSLKWAKVFTGERTSAAISTDGYLYTWGANFGGELGLGTQDYAAHYTPTKVGTLKWVDIVIGANTVSGITDIGDLYMWGRNAAGQFGLGTISDEYHSPLKLTSLKYSCISTGANHFLALTTGGDLYAAGSNYVGQVGNNSTADVYTFTKITSMKWSKISAGETFSAGITTSGDLYMWGNNDQKQLGQPNGFAKYSIIPVKVGTRKYTDIKTDAGHSFALGTDGFWYCWGRNNEGQLGLGTDAFYVYEPTKLDSLKWNTFVLGYYYTLGLI